MRLSEYLQDTFKDGLQYEDAVQLCLSIYVAGNSVVNQSLDEDITMENLAEAFASISRSGVIKGYSSFKGVRYGANYHSINEKGHWIEIQASLFKLNITCDIKKAELLIQRGRMR